MAIIQDAASSYDGSAVTGSDIDYSELYKKFKEVSETARKNFNDKITYERAGSESITLNNGKSVKTKKYTMTIPKNSIKEYVNEYVTAVVDYADENVTDIARFMLQIYFKYKLQELQKHCIGKAGSGNRGDNA